MLEHKILNAALNSRDSYFKIQEWLDSKSFSRHFQQLFKMIGEFYAKDGGAQRCDSDLLYERLKVEIPSDRHIEVFNGVLEKAKNADVSLANLESVLLDARRHETGNKLAAALINKDERGIVSLLDTYQKLASSKKLEEVSDQINEDDIDEGIDVASLVEEATKPGGIIKLLPKTLNDRMGGGVPPETHILVFGRPESGKSAEAITCTWSFAMQGKRTLHVGNEDPRQATKMRLISCLTGLTKEEILRNPQEAQRLADQRGLRNIVIASLTPGNFRIIEALIKKHNIQCVVTDQLRNLEVKADTRVLQLEVQGTTARNLTKKYGLVWVSVTQAGDSASGKAFLGMGDVDFSNTGLPGQADVMVGIGTSEELEALGERGFSLPKNKISGNHEPFYAKLYPKLSRVVSME